VTALPLRRVTDTADEATWYSYAIIRVVPRVERGEFVNVGVVVFARTVPWLAARIELAPERVRALAPEVDLAQVERHLRVFQAVCEGAPDGGPLAALPPSERFHWMTAPRSTVIQTAPVHLGQTHDLPRAMEELLDHYVRLPLPR
jgi:hypothetical protein